MVKTVQMKISIGTCLVFKRHTYFVNTDQCSNQREDNPDVKQVMEVASMPALKSLWIDSSLGEETIKEKIPHLYRWNSKINEKTGTDGIWEFPTNKEHLDLFELKYLSNSNGTK